MERQTPLIDQRSCLTCRACAGICPTGAISQIRREMTTDPALCNGCGLCIRLCPAKAISKGKARQDPRKELKHAGTPSHLDRTYDLIIAGCGIAGLSTAIGALQKKPALNVLLLDKKRKIGEDVNSSAGTWSFTLDQLPLTKKERSGIVLQEFTKFGLAVENDSVALDIGKPFLETIDLSRLQTTLSEKLVQMGAQIETNTFVENVERKGGAFQTTAVSKGARYTLTSRLIADASGIDSAVSRKLGMHKSWNPDHIGVGAEYEMSWSADPATIWFVRMKHRNLSYAWSFPTGGRTARVGVAALLSAFKSNTIQEELDLFISTHFLITQNTGNKPSKTNFKCGAYPLMRMADRITAEGALRVGDAASQANPILGEGIYYAIKYGLKAGETLADPAKEGLKPYHDYVLKDSKKFEEDKVGYEADYDKLVQKLKELKDKLSGREKQALLSFIMPIESSWDEKLKIAAKLLGYRETMKIAGRKIGKML